MDTTKFETNYLFTKEVVGAYKIEGYGILYDCKMYKLYKDNFLEGQFFYHDKVCFIGFQNYDIRIDIKKHVFKKSDYVLVDNKKGEKIGSYYLPNWIQGGIGKIGSLFIGYETYNLQMIAPDTNPSLFKKSTWGYCGFLLDNDIASIVYKCKLKENKVDFVKSNMKSLSGSVVSSNANLLTVLAGFFMVEIGIYNDETSGIY